MSCRPVLRTVCAIVLLALPGALSGCAEGSAEPEEPTRVRRAPERQDSEPDEEGPSTPISGVANGEGTPPETEEASGTQE